MSRVPATHFWVFLKCSVILEAFWFLVLVH